MSVFMKFSKVKGSVATEGYEDCVELSSFSFGTGRGVSMKPGKKGDREHTTPAFSEIQVTKVFDASSVTFLQESLDGKGEEPAFFYFVKTEGDKTKAFFEIEVEEVMLTSWQLEGGGGEPMVRMTISYVGLKAKNLTRESKGATTTPDIAGYNLKKQVAI